MNGSMIYEGFIRGAFSVTSSTLVNRWGDTAHLATTDVFDLSWDDTRYLNKAKSAVSYSIAIFNNEIFNESQVSDADRVEMENLLECALDVNGSQELLDVIEKYITYRDRYFTFIWNR